MKLQGDDNSMRAKAPNEVAVRTLIEVKVHNGEMRT